MLLKYIVFCCNRYGRLHICPNVSLKDIQLIHANTVVGDKT